MRNELLKRPWFQFLVAIILAALGTCLSSQYPASEFRPLFGTQSESVADQVTFQLRMQGEKTCRFSLKKNEQFELVDGRLSLKPDICVTYMDTPSAKKVE